MIASLIHFASLSDCYGMKDSEETFTWEQVSFEGKVIEEATRCGGFWREIEWNCGLEMGFSGHEK